MKIITESNYEIMNYFGEDCEIIEKAAYTCYPIIEKQNKSRKEILKYIVEQDNMSLFEFSWFPILIKAADNVPNKIDFLMDMIKLFQAKKYLDYSITNDNEIIVSGNGRAWYEYMEEIKQARELYIHLSAFFNTYNPILFEQNNFIPKNIYIKLLNKKEVKEDKHDWLAVKFFDVSKSFIQEVMEHRVFSVVLRKDYFSFQDNFKFVIDKSSISKNIVDMKKIEDSLNFVQTSYNYLIGRGRKRDVVRQLLPIGIANDVIIASNIEGWKNLFKVKTSEDSNWEIKILLNDLKNVLNNDYNYEF